MKLTKEIVTDRLLLLEAGEADIDFIMEMEAHPDNRDFIWQGTREEHLSYVNDDGHLLLVFKERAGKRPMGYSLSRVDFKSETYEFRRFVIVEKGRGFGREAFAAHLKYAFEVLKVNRFWLDVFPDNIAGIMLYEGFKMHRDGVLRQNYKAERGYLDQIVYSMLKSEYFAKGLQ